MPAMEPRKKRKVERVVAGAAVAGAGAAAVPSGAGAAAPPAPPASPAPTSAFALRKRLQQQREEREELARAEAAKATSKEAEAKAEAAEAATSKEAEAEAEAEGEAKLKTESTQKDKTENAASVSSAEALEPGATRARSSIQPMQTRTDADGRVHVRLGGDERLVVLGSFGLEVVRGTVTLAGSVLASEPARIHWVHAPRSHALPVLRCTDGATVVLHPHAAAPGLRRLARLSPLFQGLWGDDDASQTFQIVYASDDAAPSRDLTAPAAWNKLLAELAAEATDRTGRTDRPDRPIYFVCGPKSSGKSTFSRLLANRLLTSSAPGTPGAPGAPVRRWSVPRVAVLDIDPGQPEFGPPGLVALTVLDTPNLAPPFCHPYAAGTLRAHATAAVSPAADPAHYLACVRDLLAVFRRDVRVPLVVNTPGWVQGTGLALLRALARDMQPARVVYMSLDGPAETVQGLRSAYPGVPLALLPSQTADLRLRTPAHLRSMQAQSYFHLAQLGHASLAWDATPLASVRPWVVPYAGRACGILGVLCYEAQPPAHLVADTINGSVVALVAVERTAAFGGMASTPQRAPDGLPFFANPAEAKLDPAHARALGVALVRGIDVRQKTLHLLTPLAVDDLLDDVLRHDGLGLVLVAGKFDAPTWAYTEHLAEEDRKDDDGNDDDGKDGKDEPESPTGIPWVQVLRGRQARDTGSQVWRVRRDLGRSAD